MKHAYVRVRDSMIAFARKEGYRPEHIAAAFPVSVHAIWQSLRRTQTFVGGRGALGAASERHDEIEADYRKGMTLESIGMKIGVTRERIRQILRARGVSPKEGGRAVVKLFATDYVAEQDQSRRQARKDYVEAKTLKLFRCSYEVARELNDGVHPSRAKGTKAAAYLHQLYSAEHRVIEFNLTFPEWLGIWDASGHWAERGRGKGRYCMARNGDVGAYAVGNVEIIKHEKNSADFYKHVNRKVRDELNLTPRERNVYDLLVKGFTPKEIAGRTGMQYGSAIGYVCKIRRTFPELRQAA